MEISHEALFLELLGAALLKRRGIVGRRLAIRADRNRLIREANVRHDVKYRHSAEHRLIMDKFSDYRM